MKVRLSNKFLIFTATAFILLSYILFLNQPSTLREYCVIASSKINIKEKKSADFLRFIQQTGTEDIFRVKEKLLIEKDYLHNEGIVILGFRNDSLKFWTDALLPSDITLSKFKENNGLAHLQNGWYVYSKLTVDKQDYVALFIIKPEYEISNSYFSSEFCNWTGLPEGCTIKVPVTDSRNSVTSAGGKELFEVELTGELSIGKNTSATILFSFGIIIFLLILVKIFISVRQSLPVFILVSLILFLVRVLMIYFKVPGFIYSSSLFDLSVYGTANSFFNGYLGDILFNVLFFFTWTILFYYSVEIRFKSNLLKFVTAFIYISILIILALQFNATIENLVFNSTLSLDFSDFFSLTPLSILCILIFFMNGFSIAIHAEKLNTYLISISKKSAVLFYCIYFLIQTTVYLIYFHHLYSVPEWFWISVIIAAAFLFSNYSFTQSILSAGFRILLFSAITSIIIGGYNSRNENLKLKHLSDQLSDRQDAFLESEFLKAEEKISKDESLLKAINRLPLQSEETEKAIRQIYFTRYFEKYHIQLAVFDSLCMPYFRQSDYRLNNHDFLAEQIRKGQITISENLIFSDSTDAEMPYIGKIELGKTPGRKSLYTLFILFHPKQFTETSGFSDLMLDALQQKQSRHKNLSYAIYKNEKLHSTYGKFIYPAFYNPNLSKESSGNFLHYISEPDKNTKIIVTGRTKTFGYYFTSNSYYFLLFSIGSILIFILYHRISSGGMPFFTLNRRIQFFIVGALFLALMSLGIFSVNLVVKQSEEEQVKQLTLKAGQIQQTMSKELFYGNNFDYSRRMYTESILQKYAEIFNSDISLYGGNGILFASSRPQLFSSGLHSGFINPVAIEHFKENKSLYYVTYDLIGKLKYLSVYQAIYNEKRELSGYINLPYFSRQRDLEDGVSEFITTLINIYVVLFLVSLFTGLIVSVYITKPLRILQEQLGKIALGKKNDAIQWQSDDEIGKLVSEYNKMLLKLEESAALLAKSEREGAWQEMARQVAHEIKNPLTPMKLNIQYLQKMAACNDSEFHEKFKKLSASIIEQIDTLAHIAGEFSNFAKLPDLVTETVYLNEVIKASVALFSNEENTEVLIQENHVKAIIKADKNQCLRVFNNLVKNAFQAIPENKKGRIIIELKDTENEIEVSISDNGKGITNEMKEKIFVPNFTTKSTGTGLGLAMVKNIMQASGGSIRFESKENEGTVFYLRFPKA